MKLDFGYYFSIFWRRFPYFAVIASVFTAAGLTTALVLPAEYSSSATLMIESAQIPANLASSTVQTVVNERMQVLQQRVLTRENLLDIANRLNVYGNTNMPASKIVDDMRSRTNFNVKIARNQPTVMTVVFRAPNGNIAAKVANEYVTTILDEDVRTRTGVAGDTMQFFENEVQRASAELDRINSEILKFKNDNVNTLPTNEPSLLSQQGNLQAAQRQVQTQIEDLEARKADAIRQFEATGSLGQSVQLTPDQQALQAAQQQLEDALLVFAPDNPRVTLLRAKVKQLQDRVAASVPALGGSATPQSAARATLDVQIADFDRRIADFKKQMQDNDAQLAKIAEYLSKIPANTVILDGLTRSYANAQSQYQQASSRLAAAATGERIEALQKGQRVIVLSQATVPSAPTKPNRPLIAVAGFGAGVALGLGLIILMELLNRSVRRPVEISDKLGIAPFAVLPLIRTEQEARWRRTLMFGWIVAVVIGVPLLFWGVHTYIMPLDPIIQTILKKVGLSMALN